MHVFENHRCWDAQIHPLCCNFNVNLGRSAYESHASENLLESSKRYLKSSPVYKHLKVAHLVKVVGFTNVPEFSEEGNTRTPCWLILGMHEDQGKPLSLSIPQFHCFPGAGGHTERSRYWGSRLSIHQQLLCWAGFNPMDSKVWNKRTHRCSPKLKTPFVFYQRRNKTTQSSTMHLHII